MSQASNVPEKYRAEKREWEDKDWLYSQYWGEGRSTIDIAEEHCVDTSTIQRQMSGLGIPRRCDHNSVQTEEYDPRQDWTWTNDEDDDTDDIESTVDWSDHV